MAGRTNTSSKFNNINGKELIHSGCPNVYQLTAMKNEIKGVKRLTLGKRNPMKLNKTILLVGETGAGKSSLINALVNFAMGVSWEDKVWFEIVEKEEKRVKFESHTANVTVYELFGFEDQTLPYSLTIIDSPGYGDTKGNDNDSLVNEKLYDLFKSDVGVYEINAVGLVLKSSDNRLSDRMRYIFDSVLSLFGKDMKDNIVALITHSDGRVPKDALKALEDAKIKCAMDESNHPVHFLFNNAQNSERDQKNSKSLEASWDITQRGMIEFTDFLKETLPQYLKITADVLKARVRLKACIQNLQERVQLEELKEKEIQQTKEALKKHEEVMKNDDNFKVEIEESYKEKENTEGGGRWGLFFFRGAVTCNVCEENCHHGGCTKAWKARDCEVMRKGRCTVCKGKCPVSDHVKEEKIYVTKTRKVEITLKEVKEKYEKNKAVGEEAKRYLEDLEKAKNNQKDKKENSQRRESEFVREKCLLEELEKAKNILGETKKKFEAEAAKGTSLLNILDRKMEKIKEDKEMWLEKSFKHFQILEENALNVDSLSTLDHLDFLIEKMSENTDKFSAQVKKLKEMKNRMDQGLSEALQYKRAAQGKSHKEQTK